MARRGELRLRLTATRGGDERWRGDRGRITPSQLSALIDDPATLCFVCGPAAMVDEVPRMLGELGIDVEAIRGGRRPLVRPCLDWTERRFHLAGASGAAFCEHVLKRKWVQKVGSGRAVKVTASGAQAFHDLLGVDIAVTKTGG